MTIHWDFWLIFGVLGVLIPWRGAVRVRRLLAMPHVTAMDRLSIYARTVAFQWLLTAVVAWRCYVRGLSADNLGLIVHSPLATALVSLGLPVFFGIFQFIGFRRMAAKGASFAPHLRRVSALLMPRSLVEGLAFVALATTASLCEEFVFRGFVFAVFFGVTGSLAVAIIGSSALFAFAHLYQGTRGIITTLILGLILASLRIWPGNIVPAIALHLLVDIMAGFVAPRYLNRVAAVEAN
jgi:membrane protease YdiL (CAAX protease family)